MQRLRACGDRTGWGLVTVASSVIEAPGVMVKETEPRKVY